ncbi:hypothetical protein BUALT_Bualt10G0087300 [Buddleja alternifolia]|uniref:Uncharacterized protein n=1 Tax=Buddleja alternifolia TaxID=168488 RepID=A0AAV6WY96_9LAMI|nr:hypothetical protein BUALT_Bualt10G0087300 [Buddleja alternifolia]
MEQERSYRKNYSTRNGRSQNDDALQSLAKPFAFVRFQRVNRPRSTKYMANEKQQRKGHEKFTASAKGAPASTSTLPLN